MPEMPIRRPLTPPPATTRCPVCGGAGDHAYWHRVAQRDAAQGVYWLVYPFCCGRPKSLSRDALDPDEPLEVVG